MGAIIVISFYKNQLGLVFQSTTMSFLPYLAGEEFLKSDFDY
ncbi:hypothetical protein CLOSCI_03821 [[Clostridium] scindens ATCC 35704]|nr:hypothetical protein CLOSCI_03821 [[Clostridium] scindens ATCC 35704]